MLLTYITDETRSKVRYEFDHRLNIFSTNNWVLSSCRTTTMRSTQTKINKTKNKKVFI